MYNTLQAEKLPVAEEPEQLGSRSLGNVGYVHILNVWAHIYTHMFLSTCIYTYIRIYKYLAGIIGG